MNILSTFFECARYHAASKEKQGEIQRKRLKRLVKYVKMHSKALSELYKNIGEDFELSDLPVTTKQMLMENYDNWVTDPNVKLSELKAFVADTTNVGKRFLNKYVAVTTSGSTGFPLNYLLSSENVNILNIESILAREVSASSMAALYPNDRFIIPSGVVLENLRKYPILGKMGINHIDTSMPMPKIVDALIKIKPKAIYCTSSTAVVVADECEKRNLKLPIEQFICGSEFLTPQCAEYIEEVFDCKARNIYGCTEGGNIAFECECGHLHFHNSWDIIEAVDENNESVPFGQPSHKILLTNLSSYTVPIIRYEVTDKIIVHDEPCPCGNKNYWIEVEGRTASDPLIFPNNGNEIKISPMTVYFLIAPWDTMRRFQLVLHEGNTFECRIIFMPGVDETAVFEKVKTTVSEYLKKNGVEEEIKFYLSDQSPQIDPVTLKFKSVYQI